MSLQVTHLFKSYAGVQALQGVSFELAAGSVNALIGPNGAGKSTCFALLAGQARADAGNVIWQGINVLGLSPQARLRAGIARTFQVAQVIEALTVTQNVLLALYAAKQPASSSVFELLAQVGLAETAQHDASALSYGAKKRLEMALALASSPSLLLLDEPAAGLNEDERHGLMALVKTLPKRGITVLYTEHNMDAVFGVADRVLVLVDGRLLADGLPADIAMNAEVRTRYLGRNFHA